MASQMRMVWPRPLGRRPQNEDQVTFKRSKEFKLRNRVVEELTANKTPCLYEMSFVFTCLKDNNFNDKECFDEVKRFRDCYLDSVQKANELKLRRSLGKRSAVKDKMIAAEVNEMILKYMK